MKIVKKKSMRSAIKALKKDSSTIFFVETPFVPGETVVPEKVAKMNELLSDPHLRRSLKAHGLID